MQTIGQQGEKHQRTPDYTSWGNYFGIEHCTASTEQTLKAQALLEPWLNDKEWQLKKSERVNYNGHCEGSPIIVYQRYQQAKTNDDQEHLSAVVDLTNHQLLGLVRAERELNVDLPTHQQALQTAINFIKQFVPDLLDEVNNVPQVIELAVEDRVVFDPPVKLGHLELHWIDQHAERIGNDPLNGMKVKWHDPATGLWLWIIVNGHGEMITFEQQVSWDFNEGYRQTPMWLHDQWLTAQNLL